MENMNETPVDKCEEVQGKLSDYLEGKLPKAEISEIEIHLKECPHCANCLEEDENRIFLHENVSVKLPDPKLIESKLTRKIVGKLTTVLAVIFISFYVVLNYILPMSFSAANSKKSEELGYALKDLIQFGIPGAKLKGGYEGKSTLLDMIKTIRYEQKLDGGGLTKGVFDFAAPLYVGENDWKVTYENIRDGGGYPFFYPQHREASMIDLVIDKLEKIGDGTKTTTAIYFEKPISTIEMRRILYKINASDFDSWFVIDTGDSIKWENSMAKPYREMGFFSPQWGFPMFLNMTPTIAEKVTTSKNGSISTMSSGGLAEHDINKVVEQYKKEMNSFVGYAEKYFDTPEFTADLKKINQYITEHGIQLKGAIVGASTMDMMRLKDEKNIARIDLVEVKFDY